MKFFERSSTKMFLLAIVVFGVVFGAVSLTRNWGKTTNTVNLEKSVKQLNNLYNRIDVNRLSVKGADNVEVDKATAVLPDISEYPFVVKPITDNFITIYSSEDKAGNDYSSFLIDVAEKFNKKGVVINGVPVSVGVRAMSSNLAHDFISSGKYTPDVYMPSSEIYGNMLKSENINVNLVDKRVAGNVSGIVLALRKNNNLQNKYGSVSLKNIVDSVLAGEIAVGYANPLSNEDGLNFFISLLENFDSNNPLSENAISELKRFQDNIPFVSYDISQLKSSVLNGTLDGFVSNYHTYVNSPDLKASYAFVPFGVRKDNPVYEVGNLSDLKKQIVSSFVEYCKNTESQNLATSKGFNGYNEYVENISNKDGKFVLEAQNIWKSEKNGTSDLTAVFVADVSGSMDGSPLLKLKASLNRAASFIDDNTNVGLVTFSDTVNIALPIAKFDSTQKSYFTNAVKSMRASGGTAMFDAIIVAEKMLMDQKAQNPNTRLMIFVLTDGESNRGYGFGDIENISRGLRIPIYTIGYNADIDILEQLSGINEATTMDAETDNVIYKLESLFNAQM